MAQTRPDYYLVTSRSGDYPSDWSWEIKRKSRPIGVRLTASGFKSDMAAQFYGKKALAELLSGIAEEQERSGKAQRDLSAEQ